jgi:hypothetical protein
MASLRSVRYPCSVGVCFLIGDSPARLVPSYVILCSASIEGLAATKLNWNTSDGQSLSGLSLIWYPPLAIAVCAFVVASRKGQENCCWISAVESSSNRS